MKSINDFYGLEIKPEYYHKIHPNIKKIEKGTEETFVKIDETVWANDDGELEILENIERFELIKELKHYKERYIICLGKYSVAGLMNPKYVFGKLKYIQRTICGYKLIFDKNRSFEIKGPELKLYDEFTEHTEYSKVEFHEPWFYANEIIQINHDIYQELYKKAKTGELIRELKNLKYYD